MAVTMFTLLSKGTNVPVVNLVTKVSSLLLLMVIIVFLGMNMCREYKLFLTIFFLNMYIEWPW